MRRVDWDGPSMGLGPSVVALGVFDGVHLGHQALLSDAVALASSEGVPCVVLTFEPDPEAVLHPDAPPPRITSADTRAALIADLGVDALVEMVFEDDLADMPAEEFIAGLLVPGLQPLVVVVGQDFRFGRAGLGDVATLKRTGEAHGFDVLPHELTVIDGSPVTATRVRSVIAGGDVSTAALLLGRPFRLSGSVVHGHARGRSMGAPTANIHTLAESLIPPPGVYACWAEWGSSDRIPAATSVGAPPTFAATDRDAAPGLVEAHLIGADVELYGEQIRLDFVSRLRDQRAYDNPQALADAIAADIQEVQRLLAP